LSSSRYIAEEEIIVLFGCGLVLQDNEKWAG
jgi:hypothetical protein